MKILIYYIFEVFMWKIIWNLDFFYSKTPLKHRIRKWFQKQLDEKLSITEVSVSVVLPDED